MTTSRLGPLRALVQFAPLSLFAAVAFRDGPPTPERWVLAFQAGAVAAAVQLAFVMRPARPVNRLILGANLYLLAGGLAAITRQWWVLTGYGVLREAGIPAAMLLVGAISTFATRAGFVAVAGAPARATRRASLWLLAAAVVAVAVAFVFRGDRTLAAALPIVGLAMLQRALARRLRAAGASARPDTIAA